MITYQDLLSFGNRNAIIAALDKGTITEKELRSAYSRARTRVNRQVKAIAKSDVGFAKGEANYFRASRNLVTTRDLVGEISDLIRFASGARYTIRERREIRDKALATLAKHGIVLDKADWMKWVSFMQWFKQTEYAALYDSDSDVVMDVFEQGSTAKEWERAFREWRANNG